MNPAFPAPEPVVVRPGQTTRPPAYQALADDLRQLITSGRLRPGQRLPTEPELCARSGVSRSTVREALRMLASQSLIVTTRGVFGGSFVAEPCPERLASSLFPAVRLVWSASTRNSARHLELRELIEIPGAGLAAQRRTDAQVVRLLAMAPRPDAAADERLGAYRQFHGALAAAVQNPLYELLARPLHRLCVEVQLASAPVDWTRIADECQELAYRVRDHDVVGAQEAAERHLRHLRGVRVIKPALGPAVG
ncbi:FadR/GntR family transcriptional regulator [Pilimelia columellifera]|uniref:FadR/GntR family transcriptional regulator n=1 Tax=Pilimelia columellifera TaxID=706574 RepID=UPI0031D8802B